MRALRAALLGLSLAAAMPAAAQDGVEMRVVGDFTPDRAQSLAVLQATTRFWVLRDAGDAAAARAMMSPELQAVVTEAQLAEIFAQTPPFSVQRRPTKLTWYHQQPQWPGTSAAVDWRAGAGEGLQGGGYLIWTVQPGGGLALQRLDMTDLR
ncbi:hypothetical protein [Roseobacter sp. HKCCA0434]|uniref:hypothetical protein n=1 Tax=Roseobacter sp. HKCCA0434 TaxID=3079297 RepID=UPI002905C631|nr:hypothetical protein [Roseobacter sp. HKCCA0434]